MPRPTLLVTGFGPFPRMPRNPSAAAAQAVAARPDWARLGVEARALVLTTAYRAIRDELEPALATRPDALLMIGVAGRAARVRVETRATDRRSTLFADAEGTRASGETGRRPSRMAVLAGAEALRPFRANGVPARLSRDAGRYLCNAAYHAALAHPVPTLFVHMPPWPAKPKRVPARRPARRRAEDRFTDALAEVARRLLRGVEAARRLG